MFSYKLKIVAWITTTIFFLLDRFFKILAIKDTNFEFQILGDLLKYKFTGNENIAFSLPLRGTILLYIILTITLILVFYAVRSYENKRYLDFWLISTIVLGSASNLYDRFRYSGQVIDYIDMKYFTVFNMADVMIVGGVIGLILVIFFKKI